MTVRVDAHHHFWNPARGDYDWMPKDNAVLYRPYLPVDLVPRLAEADIGKTVLVQAAATVEETEYMLGIADTTDAVAAVVGWINFEDRNDIRQLKRLRNHPKFVGVRPLIQDIPDVDWMLRDDVQWVYSALIDLDLTFDALGFSRHLGNFLTLFKRYPRLRVVIDHCMKPQIRDHGTAREELAFWADGMARIANETGAFCKFSGLVTEANQGWAADDLRPYASHLLTVFGADRLMWGSDWPVCLLRASYHDWHQVAQDLTADLSEGDRVRIFGGTAARFYGIEV